VQRPTFRQSNVAGPGAADRNLAEHSSASLLLRGMVPVLTLYAVYLIVRFFVKDRGPAHGMANAYEVLRVEKFLGIDWENWIQTVQLPHRWLVVAANWYYVLGFLPVIVIVASLAAVRDFPAFVWWRRRFAMTLLIALIVFAIYPLAPPRMLPNMVDTLTAYGPQYYGDQHGASLFNAYGRIPSLVNVYAAMPSMHVAWSIIAGALLISAFRRVWWAITAGVLHPVLMAWAVITTANHFLLDVVIGIVALMLAIGLLHLWESWRVNHSRSQGTAS
jgi:hypothetical protein